jgi:hypothetical protein
MMCQVAIAQYTCLCQWQGMFKESRTENFHSLQASFFLLINKEEFEGNHETHTHGEYGFHDTRNALYNYLASG